MSTDNLTVEDDGAHLNGTAVATVNPPELPTDDAAINELKSRFEKTEAQAKAAQETAQAERRQREEAQRQARAAAEEAARLQHVVRSSEADNITAAIEHVTREQDYAEEAFKRAHEAADSDAMAKAQRQMANAAGRLAQLERDKANVASRVERPRTVEGRVQAPQVQVNPVDQFLSVFSPASQSWLRSKPTAITQGPDGSPRLSPKVMAAHYAAEAEGIAPDTDEYFAFLDAQTSPRKVEVAPPEDVATDVPAQPQRRAAPPSAPVSREATSSSGKPTPGKIRLTAEQAEAARYSFPRDWSDEKKYDEYAKQLLAAKAAGQIGRTTH